MVLDQVKLKEFLKEKRVKSIYEQWINTSQKKWRKI